MRSFCLIKAIPDTDLHISLADNNIVFKCVTNLSLVRTNSSGSIEVGEVSYYPVKTNAPKGVGMQLDFYYVPGVARVREVRDEVSMAALAWKAVVFARGISGQP